MFKDRDLAIGHIALGTHAGIGIAIIVFTMTIFFKSFGGEEPVTAAYITYPTATQLQQDNDVSVENQLRIALGYYEQCKQTLDVLQQHVVKEHQASISDTNQ